MKDTFARLGIPFQEKYTKSKTINCLFGYKDIGVEPDLLNIMATFDQLSETDSVVGTLFWLTEASVKEIREQFSTVSKENAYAFKQTLLNQTLIDFPAGQIEIGNGDLANEFELGGDGLETYWNLGYCVHYERYYMLDLRDDTPQNPNVYRWDVDDDDYHFDNEGDLRSFLARCFTEFSWRVGNNEP